MSKLIIPATVRCRDCNQDITSKAQYYDWFDSSKKIRAIWCEVCNYRVGKGEEVPKRK